MFFIDQIVNLVERAKVSDNLDQVIKYGDLQNCRRQFLLQYFGEAYTLTNCGTCDVCVPPAQTVTQPQTSEVYDEGLFDVLRDLRKKLADDLGVPPYIVFGNTSLQEMATYFPQSSASLLKIAGVGDKKLVQFGEVFLATIRQYAQAHQLTEKVKSALPVKAKSTQLSTGSTYEATQALLLQRQSIAQIAKTRNLSTSTILAHLEKLVETDPQLDISYLQPDPVRLEVIAKAFQQVGAMDALNPIRTLLGENFSYNELRLARIFLKNK